MGMRSPFSITLSKKRSMTVALRNWLNDVTPDITCDQAFFFFFRGRATGKVPFLASQRRREEGVYKTEEYSLYLVKYSVFKEALAHSFKF